MYSKSTNNVIQKYDHQLPSSNNKSIEKCKFEKNNIRRSSRRHVIKCHNKKRSSLLSSLMSRIERRDMLVIITFLVILISVVRPSTGTIVCNDENDCKEKCDRHCDFPIERNVDSNGKGLPGPSDKTPIEEPGFGSAGDKDIPPPAGGGDNGGGASSSGGGSSSRGNDGTTTTASDTGGISVGAVIAMSLGGFLVVAGAVALQRRPGGGLGGFGAGTGTSGEDLSAMASASGLESQTAFPPANIQSGMVDINLSDNV